MRRLFESLDRFRYLQLSVTAVAVVLLCWLAIAQSGLVSAIFLPGPTDILRQVTSGPSIQEWLLDLTYSCARVFGGFFLATALGIPIGLYIGTDSRIEAIASPLVEMARYIPIPSLLPLCILWAGVGEMQKLLVIFLGTFFQLIVTISAVAKTAPREYVDTARTLGFGEQFILWRVVLPAVSPAVLEALRVSLGWAWSYLVVAEIIAAAYGIGYRVMWSQRYLRVGLVFVGIAELAVLGLLTDLVFKAVRKKAFVWVD